MESLWSFAISLAETNYLPDVVVRAGMRQLIQSRLTEFQKNGVEKQQEIEESFIDSLKKMPIAINTSDANEQHYEVPTEFFKLCLGPRLKYSSCYFKNDKVSLAEAENEMFEKYCVHAKLVDGMSILDLGCGWGSLTLFLAEKFPNSKIFSLSNSSTQKKFIDEQATKKGFKNITVFTSDINDFELPKTVPKLDRVMSIEMFEHMKNYEKLISKISSWLKPSGKLFVHIFTFAHHSYHYEQQNSQDWMTKYFFAGGTMPHVNLLTRFQTDLI